MTKTPKQRLQIKKEYIRERKSRMYLINRNGKITKCNGLELKFNDRVISEIAKDANGKSYTIPNN